MKTRAREVARVLLVARNGAALGLQQHLTAGGLGVRVIEEPAAVDVAVLVDAFDLLMVDACSVEDELDIVKVVRASGDLVPIVLVALEVPNEDCARGLDAGADTVFGRPFSPVVLVAQVHAHIRRSARRTWDPSGMPQAGVSELRIDIRARSVSDGDRQVFLAPREAAVLRALAYRQGRYVSTETLLTMVWGDESTNVHVVASCVRQVRRRLAELGSPHLVQSRRGRGYRLSKQVVVVSGSPEVPASRRPVRDIAVRASGIHAT